VATEAKPFASLAAGLRARTGAARPAMRPQGFGQAGNGLEDLGWNDMGFEPPKPVEVERDPEHDAFGEDVVEHPRVHPTGLTPVQSSIVSPVHNQQAEIVERFNGFDDSADEEVDETAELLDAEADNAVEAAPLEVEESLSDELKVEAPELAVVAKSVRTPAVRGSSRPRAAAGSKEKAAFTLRLDKDRHLRLRLACAVDGRSAQQLVTDALDRLLERMPDLDGLAEKAKRRG
jgi:hypothetical protein